MPRDGPCTPPWQCGRRWSALPWASWANAWPWDAPCAFNAPGEHQLRREQWFNEGLYSQLAALRHVRYAVNPQLVGGFFENVFEAPSLILERVRPGVARVLAQAEDPRAESVLHARVPLVTPLSSEAMSRSLR
ncbi:hypothetical protein [Hyalangium gracile]|uniref:hypothetical protein n=1 Tax=Hyalangium gracile TaxID=394092 RepID=UPI001CCAE7E8|nr:hypothetical protein [Hyalangium gracile]